KRNHGWKISLKRMEQHHVQRYLKPHTKTGLGLKVRSNEHLKNWVGCRNVPGFQQRPHGRYQFSPVRPQVTRMQILMTQLTQLEMTSTNRMTQLARI
ncbi:hypothetical protein, partial [Corynebacterium stationis]|uniref:hypothetical protein n=1 Tax=Corynebacterium stationis TaxID=1705 RepID=UPI002605873E